ncbi:PREDICTED: muskelin isoform X1 [Rhagoletis zephyria]|uniref:muskelin isoform X1 n=1 Tax=Rhagoletis zephyria TaxID=28612 RepID=UPI0008114E85|nr:PREDICTED: muskelin isoform X1 [Rhagoletis zephyria]XP_017485403.1 PREDICTED: muskelin isoform X1 [Rhagoletis zephyria]
MENIPSSANDVIGGNILSTLESKDSKVTLGSVTPLAEVEKLSYEIHRYSSFSTNYFPENILVDCPSDQSSRWSAHTNNPPQYLTLKLKRPAIVKKIKFGKFEKSHVCNIKKFRIFGGLDEERLVLLLEGGLKNDNVPEVFNLRCKTEDGSEQLPILFVKIVPLLSWGPTFNFSIWYIELHGQDDPMYTSASLKNYNMLREIEIVKLCLKHFRQQGYDAAFRALQEQTQVQLEHTLISELHKCLVMSGDFEKAEQFITECVNEGLMDAYLNRQDYIHTWRMQHTESSTQPGNRGGHQLVVDTKKRLVYLYGGWDGYRDLSDLWVFDITNNSWTLLFEQTELFNGPTPRSCHKMVFDSVSENIFMLGRYLDNSIRTTDYIKSDFFLYDTRARTWLQICDDTSHVGGPHLVYDHQMCIDSDKRTIYVFGGKILTPRSVSNTTTNEPEYSGLFSYHIATNTWTQILVDCHHPSAAQADVLSIKSRITHCMVFHMKNRKLYIYGGQRGKEDIDDFITYDVDTQAISVLNKDNNTCGGAGGSSVCSHSSGGGDAKNEPSPGYTLRATIDCDRDEIYIFSSLSKLKDRRDIQHIDASNSFWVYSLKSYTWSRIYNCRHNAETGNTTVKNDKLEPCPRYAHQLVYDDVAKLHYLFGGNPGKSARPQMRLDDFWTLELEKPKRNEILMHCRYLVRKLHYEEMARTDQLKAMQYLRNHVAEVIDHSNAEQVNNFHKLASLLFRTDDSSAAAGRSPLATPPLGKALKMDSSIQVENLATDMTTESAESGDKQPPDEDCSNKSDVTNPTDDLSMESCDSTATSSSMSAVSDLAVRHGRRSSSKRSHDGKLQELRRRRAFLFNKLVQLMPANMVQPERNLSDFVVM